MTAKKPDRRIEGLDGVYIDGHWRSYDRPKPVNTYVRERQQQIAEEHPLTDRQQRMLRKRR